MERIHENDVDCFLLQTKQIFAPPPKRDKQPSEWRSFPEFSIWIPKLFQSADKETADEIFWSENQPEILFLNPEQNTGITLQTLKEETPHAKELTIETIKQLLEKLDDRTVCYDMGQAENEIKVDWLEYKSFAIDGRVYNVLFLFNIGKEKMLGTFYCPFEEYGTWKPMIWDIMQTIKKSPSCVEKGLLY